MYKILPIALVSTIFLIACEVPASSPREDALDTFTEDIADNGLIEEIISDEQYMDYSESAFAAAADQNRVLFFHATWCPSCQAGDADIKANLDDLPENTVVFKTDYDTYKELKAKYGVTYQHTFVQVDSGGEALTKWNGGGAAEIASNIK